MMKVFLVTVMTLGSLMVFADETAAPAATETPAVTAMATTKLAEDQIPLVIDAGKKGAETTSSGTKAMASMVIVMCLIGASYFLVRKYKTSNVINKSNMQIKVLTQHYLGPKKSLAIIHVAGESILVGITDTNISMLKSLSLIDDEVPADMPKNFSDTLTKKSGATETTTADELDEEFSFSGVTDSVSKKIKSMRSFS